MTKPKRYNGPRPSRPKVYKPSRPSRPRAQGYKRMGLIELFVRSTVRGLGYRTARSIPARFFMFMLKLIILLAIIGIAIALVR